MKKKHILVISQYFYPEQFRINDICKSWIKNGYKVTVITGIPNYPEGTFYKGYSIVKNKKETWNGIEIIRLPIIPRGKNSGMLMLNYLSFVISGFFWSKFSKLKPDLIFSFEVSPMTQALLGSWFSKKTKIPNFLYVQDLWPENLEIVAGIKNNHILSLVDKMVDYIYKTYDEIFTTSPSFVDSIVNRKVPVDKEKVHFWPQYAEDFYLPREKKLDKNTFRIAFTGNIGYAQGLDVLPLVAEKLQNEKYKFVIVGEGRYKKELEKEILEKNVTRNFIFIPKQEPEKIPDILATCQVAYISFANNDLFNKTIPAKLQSYMACGMPILAAAKGEVEKIVNESKSGICVENGNVEGLVNAIINIEKFDFEQLSNNSRTYFEQNFKKKMLMSIIDNFINKYTN
ncbi:glycosyltransferase family 4 protein [Streptococcus catagoni]|uniref:glycosyltransferase family 4 protein n=1 Tax=Streptococcus catagoni TaxID=2654874 RepID=UPI001409F260|nr:glycosyltransferase family 4 protein [Streptococcus catagoni]